MVPKKFIACILVVAVASSVQCLFELCNYKLNLKAGEKIYVASPNYPAKYPTGTSCRYAVSAPIDHQLSFKCNIEMNAPSGQCSTEIFYFNREGSELLSGSDYFCGSGTVERKSFLSDAVLSYVSSTNSSNGGGGGRFSCLVEVLEESCDCGWSTIPKVAGGVDANINEFPSMAGVVHLQYDRIFCGAAIISHRYLLSAAHCFASVNTNRTEDLVVIVGEYDLTSDAENFNRKVYEIEEIILHENYQVGAVIRHDIALLKTKQNITWNRSVGPACLPFNVSNVAGCRVDTAGWGTTSFGGEQSNRLLKTTLNVVSNEQCLKTVRNLQAGQFCTFTPGKDTCQYDSGGGLYLRSKRMILVGIVSYGFACAGDMPSVSTKVSSYLKWIQNKTKGAKYCRI